MYTVRRLKDFETSSRRLVRSGIKPSVKNKIAATIDILASGERLSPPYKDHKLTGDLKDFRECHILPDLLLIYQIRNKELILVLVNIGSDAQLFG